MGESSREVGGGVAVGGGEGREARHRAGSGEREGARGWNSGTFHELSKIIFRNSVKKISIDAFSTQKYAREIMNIYLQ